MTPVKLAIASTPLKARITPTNCTHTVSRSVCGGSRWVRVRCFALKAIVVTTTITAADNSPIHAMPSYLWASGFDVAGTHQTSLGPRPGHVLRTPKHSVPRHSLPEQ